MSAKHLYRGVSVRGSFSDDVHSYDYLVDIVTSRPLNWLERAALPRAVDAKIHGHDLRYARFSHRDPSRSVTVACSGLLISFFYFMGWMSRHTTVVDVPTRVFFTTAAIVVVCGALAALYLQLMSWLERPVKELIVEYHKGTKPSRRFRLPHVRPRYERRIPTPW